MKKNSAYFFENRINMYAVPFMGADSSVVRSSQRNVNLLKSDEDYYPQYAAYIGVQTAKALASTVVLGSSKKLFNYYFFRISCIYKKIYMSAEFV